MNRPYVDRVEACVMGANVKPLTEDWVRVRFDLQELDALRAKYEDAVLKAFEAGWHVASGWAGREDLLHDIGSPAYIKDRTAALAQFVRPEVTAASGEAAP